MRYSRDPLAFLVALALAMTCLALPAFAVDDASEQLATGVIPDTMPAMSIHDANEESGEFALQADEIPSAYSSVDEDTVTSVKNQDVFGLSWAFATCAAAESYALARGNLGRECAVACRVYSAWYHVVAGAGAVWGFRKVV